MISIIIDISSYITFKKELQIHTLILNKSKWMINGFDIHLKSWIKLIKSFFTNSIFFLFCFTFCLFASALLIIQLKCSFTTTATSLLPSTHLLLLQYSFTLLALYTRICLYFYLSVESLR